MARGTSLCKVSWDSMDTLAFQGCSKVMLWLGVPLWQSILGFHGYSGIPGIYYSNAMDRGTPMAKYPGILWILWHSRDIL